MEKSPQQRRAEMLANKHRKLPLNYMRKQYQPKKIFDRSSLFLAEIAFYASKNYLRCDRSRN